MLRSFAIAILAITGLGVAGPAAFAADDAAKQPETAPSGSPTATAGSAVKDELKSPYPDFAKVADEGHKKFMAAGCNGCHGGGGGGGMGPPLTNEVWVYGGDDDTLFRLTTLGSDDLQKAGYTRIGHENVVGPMVPFGTLIKSADDLWKILTFIRSKYSGDPAHKFGALPKRTKMPFYVG